MTAPTESKERAGSSRAVPLFCVFLLIWLFGPSLSVHIRNALDPMIFTDDVSQHVAPYLHTWNPNLPSEDYISDYLRACHPVGYRALYTGAAHVVDPRVFSDVLSYALLAVFLAILGAAVYPFGGWAASCCIIALAFSADVFIDRMMGGLVRAFAFPLSAAFLFGVLHGRIRWMIGASVIAAAFYPTVAVCGGLTFALFLLAVPARYRGDARAWSLSRRLATLAAAAAAMVLLQAPAMAALRPYGPLLPKDAEAEFPEAGLRGRLAMKVSVDYDVPLVAALAEHGDRAFANRRHWCGPFPFPRSAACRVFTWLTIAGLLAAAVRNVAAFRLLLAALVACAAYRMSVVLSPHLFHPERYLLFSVPLILLLALPLLAGTISRRHATRLLVAITALVLVVAGGPIRPLRGMDVFESEYHGFAAAIGRLPETALVAGWPGNMDYVPYLAGRRVFLSSETHMPYHRAYVEAMRGRMRALLDALFARDPAPVLRLRDDWGVTHLLVNARILQLPPPRYFRPFDQWIAAARGIVSPLDLEVCRRLEDTCLWSDGSYFLLDLARWPRPPG